MNLLILLAFWICVHSATLELTPAQAETIVLAQRVGQLSLILRSMTDANAASEQHPIHNGFMVVRNGVAIQDRAH